MPPLDPQQKKEVSDLKNLLLRTPGNPELNTRWLWDRAQSENKDTILVPGSNNRGPLRLYLTIPAFQTQCTNPVTAACADIGSGEVNILKFQEYQRLADELLKRTNLAVTVVPNQVFAARNPHSMLTKEALFEGLILHETLHADKAAFEYKAFRSQYSYLTSVGAAGVIKDTDVMSLIIKGYDAKSVGGSIAEAIGMSSHRAELLSFLPGGSGFNASLNERIKSFAALSLKSGGQQKAAVDDHIRTLREATSEKWSQSKYFTDFLDGYIRYKSDKFIEDYKAKNKLNDTQMKQVLNNWSKTSDHPLMVYLKQQNQILTQQLEKVGR